MERCELGVQEKKSRPRVTSSSSFLSYTSCMSAVYNPASGDCKLSRFDQRDARLVYDAAFDFYQNNDGKC